MRSVIQRAQGLSAGRRRLPAANGSLGGDAAATCSSGAPARQEGRRRPARRPPARSPTVSTACSLLLRLRFSAAASPPPPPPQPLPLALPLAPWRALELLAARGTATAESTGMPSASNSRSSSCRAEGGECCGWVVSVAARGGACCARQAGRASLTVGALSSRSVPTCCRALLCTARGAWRVGRAGAASEETSKAKHPPAAPPPPPRPRRFPPPPHSPCPKPAAPASSGSPTATLPALAAARLLGGPCLPAVSLGLGPPCWLNCFKWARSELLSSTAVRSTYRCATTLPQQPRLSRSQGSDAAPAACANNALPPRWCTTSWGLGSTARWRAPPPAVCLPPGLSKQGTGQLVLQEPSHY